MEVIDGIKSMLGFGKGDYQDQFTVKIYDCSHEEPQLDSSERVPFPSDATVRYAP
jgi:hypothetical protein